jgi:hypothetical protein
VRTLVLMLVLVLALPAVASAEVTVKVGGSKYREVLYPDTFRVKGKTGTYRGPVTLEMDEFPYDGNYADVATVNTDDRGEYVFPRIGPTRNARLRARIAGPERSEPLEVYVHPGVKHKERRVSQNRDRVSFTYIGHPGFAPPADSFFVYMLKVGTKTLRRLGSARTMTRVGDGRWRYTGIVKLPATNEGYRYYTLYCTRGLSAAGYGRSWRIDRSCGDRFIDFPNPN